MGAIDHTLNLIAKAKALGLSDEQAREFAVDVQKLVATAIREAVAEAREEGRQEGYRDAVHDGVDGLGHEIQIGRKL